MKKPHNLKAISVLAALAFALIISPLNVNAAAPTPATREYTVTYRPGNIAKFTDELLEEYKALYGEDKVSFSQATGSISITLPAGSAYPEAPMADDIILDDEHKDRYYLTTGWRPTDETVMEDEDYVADYAALVDAVEYSVRYVDASTGKDVLTPVITAGNVGDTIQYTARFLTGYVYDTYNKEMVLSRDGSNVLTFYYWSTRSPQYIDIVTGEGETIVNTITLPGRELPLPDGGGDDVAGGEAGEAGGAAGEDQNETGTESGENGNESGTESGEAGNESGTESDGENAGETGESNQESDTGEIIDTGELINIEDEDVPLAQFLDENGGKAGVIAGGVVGLGVIAILLLYLMRKNKKVS